MNDLSFGQQDNSMIPGSEIRLFRKLENPALGLGLGLGLGGGVVDQFPIAGAAYAADFAKSRYFGGSFSNLFTFTRASSKTDLLSSSPSGYAYSTFGVDVPAITLGQGVLIEDGSITNLFLNSTAPATQTITLSATGNYVLWVNGSGSATVAAGTAAIVAMPASNLVGAAGGLTATNGNWISFFCSTTGTVSVTITGSLNAVQLTAEATPSSFIVTSGSTATRSPDVMMLTGGTLSTLAAAQGALVLRSRATAGTGYLAGMMRVQNNSPLQQGNGQSNAYSQDNNGGTGVQYTLGLGGNTDARHALSWTGSGRSVVANGGSVATAGKLHAVTTTTARLGWSGTYWRGYLPRIDMFSSAPSDAQLRVLSSIGDPDITGYGDSLFGRGTLPGGRTVPQILGTLAGKAVLNGGVEGHNSTQIKNRFLADAIFDREVVIEAGRNNYAASSTVQADIAAMIAALTVSRYLVIGIVAGNTASEYTGGANRTSIDALNSALSSTYGTRFVDMLAAMVAAYDPGDPMEVVDFGNGVIPWRFRQLIAVSALTGAISSSATSFNTSGLNDSSVIKIGSEYIQITSRSGNNVTNCVRGFAGSTAAAHAAGDRVEQRDFLHWSEEGRIFAAQTIQARRVSLGW